ncbi:hypothetical protein FFWV33_19125 [Flavobacterium faecale]|uniref:Uncharacterized protein n=1 Tax=Flavobacterium faecale TaxID=1355330 RepID=A0A2S1LIA5_9FLAO|nr:hypothetical protein FFWV33_19125 [Flavobacterium faecale]
MSKTSILYFIFYSKGLIFFYFYHLGQSDNYFYKYARNICQVEHCQDNFSRIKSKKDRNNARFETVLNT